MSSAGGFCPGKLWSLWDIMHKIDSCKLLEIMQTFSTTGQNLMDVLVIPNALGPNRSLRYSPKALDQIKASAESLRDIANEIELPALAATANRLVSALTDPELPYRNEDGQIRLVEIQIRFLQEAATGLAVAIHDSLISREFLIIPSNKRDYFDQSKPLFGDEVEEKFQAASEDISEAGKCFAVDRFTATVFHLQRAMERVVQILGAKLNVALLDKNNVDLDWGVIVANMKAPVEAMPKGGLKDRWSEALTLLIHVKQAWRHPTMHPKKTYTEEQARDILNATGAFIRYLASLL
jgi:hypothetical protein